MLNLAWKTSGLNSLLPAPKISTSRVNPLFFQIHLKLNSNSVVLTWSFYEDIDPRNSFLFLSFLNMCDSIYSCTVSIVHIVYSLFYWLSRNLKGRMHNCLCLRFSHWDLFSSISDLLFLKFAFFETSPRCCRQRTVLLPVLCKLVLPCPFGEKIVSRKAASCLAYLIFLFVLFPFSISFFSLPLSLVSCF